jgi:hypothetical protein
MPSWLAVCPLAHMRARRGLATPDGRCCLNRGTHLASSYSTPTAPGAAPVLRQSVLYRAAISRGRRSGLPHVGFVAAVRKSLLSINGKACELLLRHATQEAARAFTIGIGSMRWDPHCVWSCEKMFTHVPSACSRTPWLVVYAATFYSSPLASSSLRSAL